MNFLIFKISLGFVSEVSLSLTIGIVITTLIATTIHIAKVVRKKKALENKQRLKAEAAERQARLDEAYFQRKAKRLEERAKAERAIVSEKSEKQYFCWEDLLKEENEHQEWLEYIG
jgi:hypothetical protein